MGVQSVADSVNIGLSKKKEIPQFTEGKVRRVGRSVNNFTHGKGGIEIVENVRSTCPSDRVDRDETIRIA